MRQVTIVIGTDIFLVGIGGGEESWEWAGDEARNQVFAGVMVASEEPKPIEPKDESTATYLASDLGHLGTRNEWPESEPFAPDKQYPEW